MLTKLAKTRIMKLVEFMEGLPKSAEKHFDMRSFVSHKGEHKHQFSPEIKTKELYTCGTTACALGWAATMPYFRRLGFSLNYTYDVRGDAKEVFDLYNCTTGYVITNLYFELFGGDNDDKTPKAWAKRVRKLVDKWEKE